MKFVDEAVIQVTAGNGGDGGLSFHREKFVPRGGPDGGDGGDGGSVYLQANKNLNTLIDFRYRRLYHAVRGENGMGKQRTGKAGEDCTIAVPIGTVVYDEATQECIGDLLHPGDRLLVARGGYHGLGNARYKSSVNRAPRQTSRGSAGEARKLRLELRLLADVGLLGLPNAGKSTLLRTVSAATPKVADYPFTTLYPCLGVIRSNYEQSFVMADIPGLISGAAEGAGLGVRFLKHLARTRLLLHIVEIAPLDGSDVTEQIQLIVNELAQFDATLVQKPRWLVFNKIDCIPAEEVDSACRLITDKLGWLDKVFCISAITGQGTSELCTAVQHYLNHIDDEAADDYPNN